MPLRASRTTAINPCSTGMPWPGVLWANSYSRTVASASRLDKLRRFASYVREHYGTFVITCDDYDYLCERMTHDKKNAASDAINFTLLSDVGQVVINQTATRDEITLALDLYRDMFGI